MDEPLPERGAILGAAMGIGLYAMAFGASFGAISIGSGLTLPQTMVLSLVMFTGASQFAFVGVAASGGSPFAAVPAALLLGMRNAFYGVPISEILHPRGFARLWTAHFVIDETTAMAIGQATPRAAVCLLDYRDDLVLALAIGQSGGRARRPCREPHGYWARCRGTRRLLGVALAHVAAAGGTLAGIGRRRSGAGTDTCSAARYSSDRLSWGRSCRRPTPESGSRNSAPRHGAHMTPLWLATIVAAVGCYLLKLAGVSLPESILNHPKVQRVAQFLPIAMLSALVAVELFDDGGRYALDWRTLAGVTAGVIALLLRRGFLVVFLVAIGVTALLRLIT